MSATGAKRALADAGRGKRQAVEQDEFTKMPVASYAGLTDGDVR